MKRISITIAIVTLFAVALTACGMQVDTSNMPNEMREDYEQKLETYMEDYKNGEEALKVEAAVEIGFIYMNLGDYDKAIAYYEEVLEYDAMHFTALNNIAVMYEEFDKIEEALEYQIRLYDANPLSKEVNGDIIRLLVANDELDKAQGVLETFAANDTEGEHIQWISEQFGSLFAE